MALKWVLWLVKCPVECSDWPAYIWLFDKATLLTPSKLAVR